MGMHDNIAGSIVRQMPTEYDQIVGDQTGFSYKCQRLEDRSTPVRSHATCIKNYLGIAKTDFLPGLSNPQRKALILYSCGAPDKP